MIRQDNILALDLATKTGYCSNGNSGTVDFRKTPYKGKTYHNIRCWVLDYCKSHAITHIVMEAVYPGYNHAATVLSRFHGIVDEAAERLEITVSEIDPQTIKEFATGNRYANKKEMIFECIRQYDIVPKDDNEADAIHLYHCYMDKLQNKAI